MTLINESSVERNSYILGMEKEQKAEKEMGIKLRNLTNENKLLTNITNKFKEERKKL